MQQTILDHFLPFHPANKPKKIFFWKNEKNYSEDIIILNKCTKSHDHMLQCFWHTTCDRCVFHFSFWAKNKKFLKFKKKKKKKKKKPEDIIILHLCTKNYDHMMYGSWDMVQNGLTDRRKNRQREKVTYRGGCPT